MPVRHASNAPPVEYGHDPIGARAWPRRSSFPAPAHPAETGYDPVYGARPLKCVLPRVLQDPLALRLLQGAFPSGETIRVDAAQHGLTFTAVVHSQAAAAWTRREVYDRLSRLE